MENGNNSYIVVTHSKHYSDSTHGYSEVDIKAMLAFLLVDIFLVIGNMGFPIVCWNSLGHILCFRVS